MATPTTISTDVPPSARAVAVEKPPYLMKSDGSTATAARKRPPATVSRTSTRSRYWAVGLPGRTPGTKPPYFFRLSACSIELKITAT